MAIIKKDRLSDETILMYKDLSIEEAMELYIHLNNLAEDKYKYELVNIL